MYKTVAILGSVVFVGGLVFLASQKKKPMEERSFWGVPIASIGGVMLIVALLMYQPKGWKYVPIQSYRNKRA